MREPLANGGYLVRLASGSLAVEGVPDARSGLVVDSDLQFLDGDTLRSGMYRVTRRVSAGTDLWHVQVAREGSS